VIKLKRLALVIAALLGVSLAVGVPQAEATSRICYDQSEVLGQAPLLHVYWLKPGLPDTIEIHVNSPIKVRVYMYGDENGGDPHHSFLTFDDPYPNQVAQVDYSPVHAAHRYWAATVGIDGDSWSNNGGVCHSWFSYT
jgi:hypothetical protein